MAPWTPVWSCSQNQPSLAKKKWADGATDLCKHLLLGIFGAFLGLAPGGEELCRDGEAVDWETWWKNWQNKQWLIWKSLRTVLLHTYLFIFDWLYNVRIMLEWRWFDHHWMVLCALEEQPCQYDVPACFSAPPPFRKGHSCYCHNIFLLHFSLVAFSAMVSFLARLSSSLGSSTRL